MPYKDKERQRAYAQRPENKERQRAYAQRPENKERQRAYAQRWYAENKERQRAYRRDLTRIMRRCELDASGIAQIMQAVNAGDRYIDIAQDWLIEESDVTAIANVHGVFRRRKALPAPQAGASV